MGRFNSIRLGIRAFITVYRTCRTTPARVGDTINLTYKATINVRSLFQPKTEPAESVRGMDHGK